MQIESQSNTPFPRHEMAPSQDVARKVSMTSLELVEFINSTKEEAQPELRHDHFMAKVPRVIGKAAPEFLGTDSYVNGSGGRVIRRIYRFPKREACLMAMSYSYELKALVFDRMTALEEALQSKTFIIPQTRADALRLAADLEEQNTVLKIENTQQARKIESLEHLFMAGETPSQFVKRLNGVNAQKINATLLEMGWIYNAESEPDRSPKYRTTSKARSKLLLTERPRKIDGEGFDKPLIRYDLQMLEAGARKLHDLYLDLRLTMKKTWDQQFFYEKFSAEASQ